MISNIKKLFNRLKKNELIRVGSSTSAANVLKMAVGIIVQKFIAVQLGPSGIAMITQFQNYISITTSFATGGIGQGIVKYISEFRDEKKERNKIISNAVYISLFCSLFVAIIQFIFIKRISAQLFTTVEFVPILAVYGVTIFLFALNNVLISLLNGFGQIKDYVVSNISRSILHLFLTTVLIWFLGLEGALWSLSVLQSIVCLVTLYFIFRSKWYNIKIFFSGLDWVTIRKLLAFSLVAFSSMVFSPYTDIEIRNLIIEQLGVDQAGLYDALVRLSRTYFTIITMSLSVYYVPKLSSIKDPILIRKELVNTSKIIFPIIIGVLLLVYLFSDLIFTILYTSEFTSIKTILPTFLIGDFFRCCAMILGYLFIAKAKTTLFIVISIASLIIKFSVVFLTLPFLALQAASLAHFSSLIFRFLSYLIMTLKLRLIE
ncbi:MAG: O-antigen translocase [Balneola sp.]